MRIIVANGAEYTEIARAKPDLLILLGTDWKAARQAYAGPIVAMSTKGDIDSILEESKDAHEYDVHFLEIDGAYSNSNFYGIAVVGAGGDSRLSKGLARRHLESLTSEDHTVIGCYNSDKVFEIIENKCRKTVSKLGETSSQHFSPALGDYVIFYVV